MQDKYITTHAEDEQLGTLLAAAGPRVRPADADLREARAAVEAEWREVVAARQRRRQFTTWAAAAGVAAVALTAWLLRPVDVPVMEPFAKLARVEGAVEYRGAAGDAWRQATTATSLSAGSQLRTGATGRAALALDSGVAMRVDTGTRLAFADPSHASLEAGAIYVDAGEGEGGSARDFSVATTFGDVRHLGTQYEARLLDDALRVGVREGRVGIGQAGSSVVAAAGEQVLVSGEGVTRSPLPAHDAQWAWIGSVTPPFAIEGRSVDEFLSWAARETGRQVVYESPAAARQAQDIMLRGSVAGLTPERAVKAVLSTTPLAPAIETDRIRIEAGR